MKKILILIFLLAFYYSSKAQLSDPPFEESESNYYRANVYCVPYLGPENETSNLGDFFTGGEYTDFVDNEQEFKLSGAGGMKFSVSSTTMDNVGGVTIDYLWSINSTGIYKPLALNTEISNDVVTLPAGIGCDVDAFFKCEVKKLKIPDAGIAPGYKTFNVTVNATLIEY
jgi:hypothetical protein